MKQLLIFILLCLTQVSVRSQDYDVGVFYFPGWETTSKWDKIETFNQGTPDSLAYEKRTPIRYTYGKKYYEESNPYVLSRQMKIMKDYEIDYVVFDSYWEWNNNQWQPFFRHVLDQIYDKDEPDAAPDFNFHGMDFAIRWSSDFAKMVAQLPDAKAPNPNGCRGFLEIGGGLDQLIDHWRPYLEMANYKRINGKPVIYMGLVGMNVVTATPARNDLIEHQRNITNTIEGLCEFCANDEFFEDMDESKRNENYINWYKVDFFLKEFERRMGFPIYWVAAFHPPHDRYGEDPYINYDWLKNFPERGGFDGLSAYTYKYHTKGDIYGSGSSAEEKDKLHCRGDNTNKQWSHYDYNNMARIYKEFWNFVKRNPASGVKYHVPVTAGWNRAPQNLFEYNEDKTKNSDKFCKKNNHKFHNYDQAISDAASFEDHLIEARNFINANQGLTDQTVMVCCWNEYFEGTVIEPTIERGYSYVNAIKRTFSAPEDIEDPGNKGDLYWRAAPEVEDKTLRIYPNPVEDMLTVKMYLQEAGPMHIQVYDLSGKSVKTLDLDLEQGSSSIQINMFDLKPGIYNVELIAEGEKTVKKVSVE